MRVDVGVNDESHGGFSGCGDRGSDSGEDKRTGFRVRDRVVHSRVCDAHVFCGEQVQTYSFVHRQADCVRVGEYFIYRRDPENDRYSVYMPISSDICKDAGCNAMASQVEMAGKITLILLSMPILMGVIDLVVTIVEG